MKKKTILFLLLAVFCFGIFLLSCKKEKSDSNGTNAQISFSINGSKLSIDGSKLKSALALDSESYKIENAKKIVITIENIDGSPTKYTSSDLSILQMNGSFYSQKIALKVGSYKLTEFDLVDANGNTIFAAPLTGSLQAQNVSNPLPIIFEVTKNTVTPIDVEVLSTENLTPEDFGLIRFPFTSINTFSFLIAVADQQQDILLSATIVITSGSYNYTQELDKIANNIVTIKDGLTNYMVVVQKQGYKSYTYTFTLDSLKTYEVKAGNLPLVVELTKNDLVTDLVAYYPFNANANDESGNGNNGIVNNGTLVPDRKGNINSAYYFDFDLGISVPGFGDVVPTDEITISLWATAPESNTNFPIFLGSIYDQSRLSISINYFHDGQNTIFWDYGYRQESGDAPGRLYYRPAPVDGNWHHYVFISSTSEHTMKMFKDNVLLCEKTESLSLVNPAGKILYIGTRFKGNLDDIRIYKRILNAEEIAALYNE